MASSLLQRIKDSHSFDSRSLAFFRISLAVVVFLNLWGRFFDLEMMYSDTGALPRSILLSSNGNVWDFSFFFFNGSWIYSLFLFLLAFFVVFFFLIGFKTRFCTFFLWLFVFSLNVRNHHVNNAGDTLLLLTLFWSMFLPLEKMYSVDSFFSKEKPEDNTQQNFSMASVALFYQIMFMYVFTGLLKCGDAWTKDGTALYYALSYDQYAKPLAHWLLQFPLFLKTITPWVRWFEVFFPLVLLLPFYQQTIRNLFVFCFLLMHLSFDLCFDLGLFPYIDMAVLVVFLPSSFWEFWNRKRKKWTLVWGDEKEWERKKILLLLKGCLISFAQKEKETEQTTKHFSLSWVGGDSSLGGQKALLLAIRHSPFFFVLWPFFALLFFFSNLAIFRGKKVTFLDRLFPWLSSFCKVRKPLTVPAQGMIFSLLLYVFLWNMNHVHNDEDYGLTQGKNHWKKIHLPESWKWLGYSLGLDQEWGMFASEPPSQDGWFVITGLLQDRSQVDVFPFFKTKKRNHPLSFQKPYLIYKTFKNYRHSDYFAGLILEEDPNDLGKDDPMPYWKAFSNYTCDLWNAKALLGKGLVSFTVYFMEEWTEPTQEKTKVEKRAIWEQECGLELSKSKNTNSSLPSKK